MRRKENKPIVIGLTKPDSVTCNLAFSILFLNNNDMRKGTVATKLQAYIVVGCMSLSIAFLMPAKKIKSEIIASQTKIRLFKAAPFNLLSPGYFTIQIYEANPHNTGFIVSINIRPRDSLILQGYHKIRFDNQYTAKQTARLYKIHLLIFDSTCKMF